MDGYSLDVYWVDNYWFNNFLWWMIGALPSPRTYMKYVVRFEDRAFEIMTENRKFVVPVEDRTYDSGQS
jgi:hypothetical protein